MNGSFSDYPCNPPDPEPLIQQLLEIRKDILGVQARKSLDRVADGNRPSALNLLHYMSFRRHDLRDLQLSLSEWGLSSLGRAERKVQATVDTVLHTLHRLAGRRFQATEKPPVCYHDGRRRLEDNAENLFGSLRPGRRVRIMVTMPSEAAENYGMVQELLLAGMDCARINCAHDGPDVWEKIVANIRLAEQETGNRCRIQMDLGGPKLRTGGIEPGPQVVKLRPRRDALGRVEQSSRVWLYAQGDASGPSGEAQLSLPVPSAWLERVRAGDTIRFRDARRARRRLKVVSVDGQGVLTEMEQTAYFTPGTVLSIVRDGKKRKDGKAVLDEGIAPLQGAIPLQEGDRLILLREDALGTPATQEADGTPRPARVACSIPEVFDDLAAGDPIFFDDGKIGGVVEQIDESGATVLINQTKPGGDVLRAEKGINLPETRIRLPALSAQDLQDLEFVVAHADIVALSFVNRPRDVHMLNARLRELTDRMPAVVLKIETRQGFESLPELLLAAMENPTCGVMIARGDLAVECGFGRLAEVQEQILWVCEAAHMPVIWATQVLEGLAKSGLPTRAEVTDAAMGQRAECIMLNKGPHILRATKSLGEIMQRMQDHQTKKRSLLRKLQLAERFLSE